MMIRLKHIFLLIFLGLMLMVQTVGAEPFVQFQVDQVGFDPQKEDVFVVSGYFVNRDDKKVNVRGIKMRIHLLNAQNKLDNIITSEYRDLKLNLKGNTIANYVFRINDVHKENYTAWRTEMDIDYEGKPQPMPVVKNPENPFPEPPQSVNKQDVPEPPVEVVPESIPEPVQEAFVEE